MKTWHKLVSLLLFLTIVGYGFNKSYRHINNLQNISSSPSPTTTQSLTFLPSTCHSNGILPDANCTPGAINSEVTQDTIQSTICVKGYTKTIRPPVSYTNQLKRQQIQSYGYTDTNPADYEEDHFIPLEVGGNPTDPKNLWPQPHFTTPSSLDKDKIENLCHEKVCLGQLTLQEAQEEIIKDWTTACQ
jgi:hypothetical protein